MSIKVDIAKPAQGVEKALARGHLFKDLSFDLNMSSTQGRELFRDNDKKDLVALFDANSVLNSIKNILTTTPGQKLLNPLFGLDLRNYLFEPVTTTRAFFIAQDILTGLVFQEPRVNINNINIQPNPDDMQYIIDLTMSIPSLNIYKISLKGLLDKDGYNFI
jgi:phage baseplate assembly protein W